MDQPPSDGSDLLDLRDCHEDPWARQPYESIDDWTDRLQRCLCTQRDTITNLEEEYQSLEKREKELTSSLQSLIGQTEGLRKQWETKKSRIVATPPPPLPGLQPVAEAPFMVYVVQKGDTLCSIARKYYHDASKWHDILRWNAGWIRHPNELVAGVGLALFPKERPQGTEKDVEDYVAGLTETSKAR